MLLKSRAARQCALRRIRDRRERRKRRTDAADA